MAAASNIEQGDKVRNKRLNVTATVVSIKEGELLVSVEGEEATQFWLAEEVVKAN